jgi:hypothetical protein
MLLWGGGVYDWFDPVTVVRAVERVEGAHLVFMAAGHPNSELPTARALGAAREAAGPRVHFHDGWVEYDRRADWLLDADAGVSAHHEHVETRFAFRTRILDYLWAGLPVLCTRGDALADEVQRADVGATLAPEDVDGWVAEMENLKDAERRAACGARAAELARALTWEQVSGPLAAYCAAPRRAPDLAAGGPLRPRTRQRALAPAPRGAGAPSRCGPMTVCEDIGAWAAGLSVGDVPSGHSTARVCRRRRSSRGLARESGPRRRSRPWRRTGRSARSMPGRRPRSPTTGTTTCSWATPGTPPCGWPALSPTTPTARSPLRWRATRWAGGWARRCSSDPTTGSSGRRSTAARRRWRPGSPWASTPSGWRTRWPSRSTSPRTDCGRASWARTPSC